jgi:hypothetical protein
VVYILPQRINNRAEADIREQVEVTELEAFCIRT